MNVEQCRGRLLHLRGVIEDIQRNILLAEEANQKFTPQYRDMVRECHTKLQEANELEHKLYMLTEHPEDVAIQSLIDGYDFMLPDVLYKLAIQRKSLDNVYQYMNLKGYYINL